MADIATDNNWIHNFHAQVRLLSDLFSFYSILNTSRLLIIG